jgi:hypothetical protein
MRRLVVLLGLVGVLAGGTAAPAPALVDDSSISVQSNAQFVTPTTIQVAVTYVCPSSFVTGSINVFVTQEATGGNGFGFMPVPCTDKRETVVVVVDGGPFTTAQAIAQGSINGAFFGDFQRRQIQITL